MRSIGAAFGFLVLTGALAVPAIAQPASETPRPQPPRGVLPPQSGAPAVPSPAPQAPAPQAPATQVAQPEPQPLPPASTAEPVPSELVLGAPAYPGATFLGSFNAGQGQRYYLFGTTDGYASVVAFYRQALKSRGSEVYDVPPVWTFDLGRFREDTMAYPPSVVVRDHVAGGLQGYLHANGLQAERYATVIQIVPAPLGARR